MRKKLERGEHGAGKSTKRMRDSQPFDYVYCEWVTPNAINGGSFPCRKRGYGGTDRRYCYLCIFLWRGRVYHWKMEKTTKILMGAVGRIFICIDLVRRSACNTKRNHAIAASYPDGCGNLYWILHVRRNAELIWQKKGFSFDGLYAII